MIPRELLLEVVQAARELHERRMWRRFENFHCFAIRLPDREHLVLGCVMGAGGEEYGLMLFPGENAADHYTDLGTEDGSSADASAELDMLSYSLKPFGRLASEDQAFYRRAGIFPPFDDLVPDFLVKPAHRQGREPDTTDLALLLKIIKIVLAADRRKLLQPAELDDEEGICVITPRGDLADPAYEVTREPWPRRSPAARSNVAAVTVPSLLGWRRFDATWLVGTVICPEVLDDDRFLQLVLVVDGARELIMQAAAVFSEQTQEAVDAVVAAFRSHPPRGRQGIPKRMIFSSRRIYDAMATELTRVGVTCVYQKVIPELQAIAAEFEHFLDLQGPLSDDYAWPYGDEDEDDEDELPALDDLSGWKAADRRLATRMTNCLRESSRLVSSRAAKRYFEEDDIQRFFRAHAQRGVVLAYVAWAVLDYRPRKDSATRAEILLDEGLPAAEAMLLRARMDAHPSIYRVAAFSPQDGTVTLDDILLGGTVTVHDQVLSENIAVNQYLTIRVFPVGQFHFLECAGPPLGFKMVLEAVDYLKKSRLKFTPEELKRGAHKLGWLWGWSDGWEARNPAPELRTTDGDPVLYHTASFAVADSQQTREALLRREDIDYLEAEDQFRWFRESGDKPGSLGSLLSLGTIQLIGDELVLTTISAPRFEAARQWLTALPGVTFRDVTTQRLDPSGKDVPLDDRISPPKPAEVTPEMADVARKHLERHFKTWLDTPLPVLDGLTPREACRTPSGRERVTLLIRTMPDPMGDVPVRVPRQAMLRELGLDG